MVWFFDDKDLSQLYNDKEKSNVFGMEAGTCDEEKKVTPYVVVNNTIRYGIRKMDPCINKVLELENIQ